MNQTKKEPDADKPPETAREKALRLIAENPRFIPAKPSGQGIVIVGAKPQNKE